MCDIVTPCRSIDKPAARGNARRQADGGANPAGNRTPTAGRRGTAPEAPDSIGAIAAQSPAHRSCAGRVLSAFRSKPCVCWGFKQETPD
jgi:hypothetical protein